MSPKHLSDTIPRTNRRYASRNADNISIVRVNNNYFKQLLLVFNNCVE